MRNNKFVVLTKKAAPVLLTVTLAGNSILGGTPATAFAATEPQEKEEVVYAVLDNSGKVNGLYVVNSFTNHDIVDYGDYETIKNLTTTDAITQEGDKISFHTDADKVYYQGDLKTKEIPWNIEIHYWMDDKEYSAEELAGKSGKLKITINITENKKCDASFWDGYALQASLALDSKKCTNIEAPDATIANVGSDKQLSYIIMPGKGADVTITADVEDFEMDAISINGTKLNLEFDFEQNDLLDQVSDIQDAIKELNDGANDLNDGASELNDGAKELKDGASQLKDGTKDMYDGTVSLKDGANTLNEGVKSLNDGIETVQTALNTLNGKSGKLTQGSAQVLEALQKIQTSLKQVKLNTNDLATLSSASTQINTGIGSLVDGLKTIDSSIDTYYNSLSAAGISSIDSYIGKHNDALSALSITDTQRALYQSYLASGTNGVMQKLSQLVAGGNTEATALYSQYETSGKDASVIVNYVTTAGKLIGVETLLKGDIAYIQGSNQLIRGIDAALDSQNGQLMTGALSLQSNYKTFNEKIQTMTTTLKSLATNMETLKTGINLLVTNYKKVDSGLSEYTDAVKKITDGYDEICKGSYRVTNGTSALYSGTKDLVKGAMDLYNGSTDLSDGTSKLADGTNELSDGTNALTDGTSEFYDKTKNMDTEITDTIDDTIDELTGKNIETISFVSDKNTNVDSVLFVIKTPEIKKAEVEEPVVEEEEEPSFKTKFLKLFGLD